jgi:hypothetical protein
MIPPLCPSGQQEILQYKMRKEIRKILIANRGVPAVRIMHTCRDRKIPTTAVYSAPDRLAYHVFMADTAIHIGEAPPSSMIPSRKTSFFLLSKKFDSHSPKEACKLALRELHYRIRGHHDFNCAKNIVRYRN